MSRCRVRPTASSKHRRAQIGRKRPRPDTGPNSEHPPRCVGGTSCVARGNDILCSRSAVRLRARASCRGVIGAPGVGVARRKARVNRADCARAAPICERSPVCFVIQLVAWDQSKLLLLRERGSRLVRRAQSAERLLESNPALFFHKTQALRNGTFAQQQQRQQQPQR